jgi:hypothetical protein
MFVVQYLLLIVQIQHQKMTGAPSNESTRMYFEKEKWRERRGGATVKHYCDDE